MDFLSNIAQQLISVFYTLTKAIGVPNYGIAIILMTIFVKIILYPLTKKQIESTKGMMKIQPKMKQIQERYKDDKQRMNMELANLYKTEGINPMAGCLPLLVQMPIMIGIFYGIREFQYAGPTTFLCWDISKTAHEVYTATGFSVDLALYMILPVLSALSTYIQSKQTMPASGEQDNGALGSTQKMMTSFMPLFMGYISFDFPIGLVLYWVVMNVMQIGQQAMMEKGAK